MVALLATAWANLLLALKLLLLLIYSGQIGTATVFWAVGDPQNPDPTNACYKRAVGIPKFLNGQALAFAHKKIPCGAIALIYNPRTRQSVIARKWDWGPREGLIDLTRATAKALDLNGKEGVIVAVIRNDFFK